MVLSKNLTTKSRSLQLKQRTKQSQSRQKTSRKSGLRKMSVGSAKAKGRKLQTWVAEKLLSLLKNVTELDIKSTPMGVNGVDVQLSSQAFKQFPYNIECKNTERLTTIYNYYEQAVTHNHYGEPLLVIKMNRKNPLIIVDAEHFIKRGIRDET